jgi:hypothetical protein
MRLERRLEKKSNPVILGDYKQISSIVQAGNVDRIIVALDERRGKFPIDELLSCRMKGIKVEDGVTFTEYLAGKLSIENLHPSSLIFSDGFKSTTVFKMIKRWFDLLISIVCLTFFFPVGLVVAIAVKLDSEGPVFYQPERVGEDGNFVPCALMQKNTVLYGQGLKINELLEWDE